MTTYNRGNTPDDPGGIPKFLRQELEKIKRAFASIVTTWDGITGKPANVTAFGTLVGSADKVPYFTALATLALADLTPYARTIIACANAAAARTALGLGTLATLSTITEANITLANNATNDVSITKHGFAPILPNDSSKFLNGVGLWTAPSVAAPTFPITSGGGLMFRYNASLSQTDQSSLGRVNKIYDISGNARHSDATATAALSPKFLYRGFLNGFPGLWFSGGQRITVSALPGLGSPLACTIIVVGQDIRTQAGNSHIYNYKGNPIGFGSSTPLDFMYNGTLPGTHPMSGESIANLPTALSGFPVVAIHVYNGASSIQSINNNAVTISPGTAATGTTNNFSIGADSATTPANFSKMILHEIAVISGAISGAQITALYAYYTTLLGMAFP